VYQKPTKNKLARRCNLLHSKYQNPIQIDTGYVALNASNFTEATTRPSFVFVDVAGKVGDVVQVSLQRFVAYQNTAVMGYDVPLNGEVLNWAIKSFAEVTRGLRCL
jgi:hypothetical protein